MRSGKDAKAAFAKGKGTEPSAQRPDCEVGKSRGEREPHLDEKRGIGAGAWRGKGGLHSAQKQFPRKIGRTRKENLSRANGKKHEPVRGCKIFEYVSQSFGFNPSLAKTEMGKKSSVG